MPSYLIDQPNIVGNYFAGKQAKQQEQEGIQRNALLQAQQDYTAQKGAMERQKAQAEQEEAQRKQQIELMGHIVEAGQWAGNDPVKMNQAVDYFKQFYGDAVEQYRDPQKFSMVVEMAKQQLPQLLSGDAATKAGFQPGTVAQVKDGAYSVLQQPPKPDTPNLPSGYEPDPKKPGALRPIAGGPAAGMAPENVESVAQQIATYRKAPLGSFALKSAFGAAVTERVAQLNPNYDETNWQAKSKAVKEFTSGKLGNQVRSFNVGLAHLDTLAKLSEALGNGDTQVINQVANAASKALGKPAPTNFEAAKKLVGDEIVKAIVGAGGGVADREEAAKSISSAGSPQQLMGVINTYRELFGGQLGGLQQQYEQATGLSNFSDMLSEEGKQYVHGGKPAAQSGWSIEPVKP